MISVSYGVVARWLTASLGAIVLVMMNPALAGNTPLPNVLLIVADDLGVGDLHSFSATAQTQTPTIDALAAQGMRFSRFYTDSTCSASRASLLTGQSPARLGFHPVARGISPDVVTLPEWLRDMGYSTHLVGKWHMGELNADAMPTAQGFDSFFGYLNQWFLQGADEKGKPAMRAPVYENPWLQDESYSWKQYQGYLPDILTQRATEEISTLARSDKPWFLMYATPLPHGPIHTPPEELKKIITEDEQYRAMVRHLDGNVSTLLETLQKTGQRDNSIIIFLSDNGAPEKRVGSNAGFAGGKAHYSEGAVRTPMFWVDPKHVLPKALDERAITIADLFPTLAARLGKPLPFATDGVDFNSFDAVKTIIDRPLFWVTRNDGSILSADKQWRATRKWMFREMQSFYLWHIEDQYSVDKTNLRFLYFLQLDKMKNQFLAWLNDVSKTVVKQQQLPEGGMKITGSDFLRTPLMVWDFYVAVSAPTDSSEDQVLAEQAGVWSLRYNAEQKKMLLDLHGYHWEVPYTLPASCTLIGLNADIYDRYTNISKTINPTKVALSINGKEQARIEKWQIDSLADVKTSEPTWLGISATQKSRWQGKMSAAVFYHRANRVGDWPYFLNEAKLQEDLCASLH